MRLGRQENVSETTTMLWWRLFVVSAVRLHSCTLDPSASSMQSSSSSFCLQRYPRSCVSWDTRKGQNSSTFFMDGCADIKTCSVLLCADPLQMNWLKDGCVTNEKGPRHTECLCNHLTYFSVMVVSRAAVVCTIVRSCVSVRGLHVSSDSTTAANGASTDAPSAGAHGHYICGLRRLLHQLCCPDCPPLQKKVNK